MSARVRAALAKRDVDERTRRRRTRRRVAEHLADLDVVFPCVDPVLLQRPEIAEVRGAGVVIREGIRWSA